MTFELSSLSLTDAYLPHCSPENQLNCYESHSALPNHLPEPRPSSMYHTHWNVAFHLFLARQPQTAGPLRVHWIILFHRKPSDIEGKKGQISKQYFLSDESRQYVQSSSVIGT
jgi:hypothetical protein